MLEKILVPVDGSKTSLRALDFAIYLGKQLHSQVIALEIKIAYAPTTMDSIKETKKAPADSVQPLKLAEMAAHKASYDNVAYKQVINTNPAATIAQVIASEKIDMVVMGNRGLGVLSGLLMGSVSTEVVQIAKCPVVIVK